MSKQKIVILSTVFVDVLGFGIVIPILPFYVSEFGAKPVTITLLFSVFSFCAFLSSPFLGAISDRIGRRPILLISIFSTAIGWFVFASADSIFFLFLGRIIDGVAAGNFISAQSYLIDIAKDEKERVANLGIIGATFGMGFILGPIFGGILSNVSHAFPFYAASFMAMGNGITAFFILKESNHQRSIKKLSYNPFKPIFTAFLDPKIRLIFVVWLLLALIFVVVQSVFALFSQQVFGFNAFQTGLFFTIIGIIIAINQVALLNKFWLKRFEEKNLERFMIIWIGAGLLMMASQNLTLFFISLPFIGTGQALLRVVIANQAIAQSDPTRKGEIMGTISSIMNGSMVVGPVLSGFLFEINPSIPFILAMILSMIAFFISNRSYNVKRSMT
ncbi:MAG: MFS transporter [Bacteroidota bacterium]